MRGPRSSNAALRIGGGPHGGGALAKSGLVVVCAGNSLTYGQDSARSYPTQLQDMLTASGYAGVTTNAGHPGWTTAQIAAVAAAEVDPLYDARKWCVCILWEGTNDLYFGETPAQSYADLKAYAAARRAKGFKVIVATVLPRANPGTPAGFETDRQTLNTLLRAGVGTDFDGLIDVGADSRIGAAGACADGFYYFLSGGSDTQVHLLATGDAIVAAAAMDAIRALSPALAAMVPYIPQHAPYLLLLHEYSDARNAVGSACSNADPIASAVNRAPAFGNGNSAQSSSVNRLSYDATGFGGLPAWVNAGGLHWIEGATISLARSTIVMCAKPTTAGAGCDIARGGGNRLAYLDFRDGAGTFCAVDTYGGGGSIKTAGTGAIVDGSPHLYTRTSDGTYAGLTVYKDGSAVTLTTYSTFSANAGSTVDNNLIPYIFGNSGAAGFVGSLGAIAICGIPLSRTEARRLEAYWGAQRGITIA